MSLSITDLLGGVNVGRKVAPQAGQLDNPDIPELDESDEIKDMFYMNMRAGTLPRNGSGYSLPRQRIADDPRKESFLMDRAIDPNIIRSKTDPDSAHPSGMIQSLQSLEPASVQKRHKQIDLVKASHTSEYNFRNRYAVRKPQGDQTSV